MDAIFKFLERLGVTLAPLLCATWIACVCALTLPYRYARFMAAKPIVDMYRGWVILALIGTTAYLIVMVITRTATWIGRWYHRYRVDRNLRKRLEGLSVPEKQVLRQYLIRGTRTLEWDAEHPIVNSLVAYGILFPTSSSGNMFRYPHDVQDDVWDFLRDHPEVITTPNDP